MIQPAGEGQPLLSAQTTGAFRTEDGDRMDLRISVFVTSVHNINAAMNCFDCDFTMSLSWNDPKVAEKMFPENTYLTLGDSSLDADSRPDVFIINDLASDNDKNLVAEEIYVVDTKKGRIVNNRRMRGTFSHVFDLHSFPFDIHALIVKFYFHSCYHLVGPVEDIHTAWWGRQGNSEFHVGDKVVDRFYHLTSEGSGITFECYEFEVRVARMSMSHIVNIGFVVEGLYFLGLSVHLLENDEINDRINLTMITVLTYSAFKMMVASMVPALGYLTLMDIWIMTGFCLGLLSGFMSMGVAYYLTFNENNDFASKVNEAVLKFSLGCWALLHLVLLYKSGFWKRTKFFEL